MEGGRAIDPPAPSATFADTMMAGSREGREADMVQCKHEARGEHRAKGGTGMSGRERGRSGPERFNRTDTRDGRESARNSTLPGRWRRSALPVGDGGGGTGGGPAADRPFSGLGLAGPVPPPIEMMPPPLLPPLAGSASMDTTEDAWSPVKSVREKLQAHWDSFPVQDKTLPEA